MGWLSKLAGIDRRQQMKKVAIKIQLNQTEPLPKLIQRRKLNCLMCNTDRQFQLPAKALTTLHSRENRENRDNRLVDNRPIKNNVKQTGK